jgi:hypothetical protein
MTLYSYLPLLKGWSYSTKDIDVPFTVPKGLTKLIDETTKEGWFIAGMCSLSDPNAEFIIVSYDPSKGYIESSLRPIALKEAGLIAPNPTGIWCSRYDDTAQIYIVCYMPTIWMPFTSGCKLSVKASTDKDLTVYNYTHILAVIDNRNLFLKSLHEALGSTPITPL